MKERLRIALDQSDFYDTTKKGERRLNLSAFARCVGVKPQAVYPWLTGKNEIATENIVQAARCLGVRVEWLARGDGPMRPIHAGVNYFDKKVASPRTIAIIPWEMAGNWQQAQDQPGVELERTQYFRGGDQTFALVIEGDANITTGRRSYYPGELIHVDPEQTHVRPGDMVIALLQETGQVVLREYQYEGGRPYLAARNPQFHHIFSSFEVIGRVVAKVDLDY